MHQYIQIAKSSYTMSRPSIRMRIQNKYNYANHTKHWGLPSHRDHQSIICERLKAWIRKYEYNSS